MDVACQQCLYKPNKLNVLNIKISLKSHDVFSKIEISLFSSAFPNQMCQKKVAQMKDELPKWSFFPTRVSLNYLRIMHSLPWLVIHRFLIQEVFYFIVDVCGRILFPTRTLVNFSLLFFCFGSKFDSVISKKWRFLILELKNKTSFANVPRPVRVRRLVLHRQDGDQDEAGVGQLLLGGWRRLRDENLSVRDARRLWGVLARRLQRLLLLCPWMSGTGVLSHPYIPVVLVLNWQHLDLLTRYLHLVVVMYWIQQSPNEPKGFS